MATMGALSAAGADPYAFAVPPGVTWPAESAVHQPEPSGVAATPTSTAAPVAYRGGTTASPTTTIAAARIQQTRVRNWPLRLVNRSPFEARPRHGDDRIRGDPFASA